jgi:SAM-dependent methyltransferase
MAHKSQPDAPRVMAGSGLMNDSARRQREADLVAYYDAEVRERADRPLPSDRLAQRDAFVAQLKDEGLERVLEIGSGPGRDGEAFVAAGLTYTGVDLAPESVNACRAVGLDAHVASVLELPFEDAAFDAGWTMSTLLHIANEDLPAALAEIVRVLRPGSPLAIGLWGDELVREHSWDDDRDFGPPRFFSIRTDDVLREELAKHATIEQWTTWEVGGPMHYQWVLLRTAG